MNKKLIRLTESDLHRIVKDSVNKILRESSKVSANNQDDVYTDIIKGSYDNILDDIINYGPENCFDIEDTYSSGWQDLRDAAIDRKSVLDKDFAMKNGEATDDRYERYQRQKRIDLIGNELGKVRYSVNNPNTKSSDEVWFAKESGEKYPNTYKRNGKLRKSKSAWDVYGRMQKDLYGTDKADKRPLHRKGSLNRAFDD